MNKVCNHSKAIKVEQESNTKTNTVQCKQATQQISTTQSTITKQTNCYFTNKQAQHELYSGR